MAGQAARRIGEKGPAQAAHPAGVRRQRQRRMAMKIGAGGGRGWPPWPACWRQGRRWCCWCWWWWRPRRRRRQPRPGRIVGSGWRQQRAAAVLGHGRGSRSSRLHSRSLSSSQQDAAARGTGTSSTSSPAAASRGRGVAVSVRGGPRLGAAGAGPRWWRAEERVRARAWRRPAPRIFLQPFDTHKTLQQAEQGQPGHGGAGERPGAAAQGPPGPRSTRGGA